jgi:4'-phosphopantetheinyl transferase
MAVYWLEQAEADVPATNHWVSGSEAIRMEALRFAKRRCDWRLGRWTAKRALAAYLNLPNDLRALADIEICPAPSGAPEAFVANQPAPVVISISHRNGVAACATAPQGTLLGCDLEVAEPRSDAFVADYFTSAKQSFLACLPEKDRFRVVALFWSAKESALKALRLGLRVDTRTLTVNLRDRDWEYWDFTERPHMVCGKRTVVRWHPLQVRYVDGQEFHGWWQSSGDFLGTLVAVPAPLPPMLLEIERQHQMSA